MSFEYGRWEITSTFGPCDRTKAEELLEVIAAIVEWAEPGTATSLTELSEEDE